MTEQTTTNKRTLPPGITTAAAFSLLLLVSGCGDATTQQAASVPVPAALPSQAELDAKADAQWALVDTYCSECHNVDDFSGGLAFDLMDHNGITKDAETWERVVRKLRGRMMPPPGNERPENAEIDALVAWLEGNLDQPHSVAAASGKPLHRMNRTEYANAIRDLLKLDVDVEALLPVDGAEDGFDNIASALQVTPTFIDQYIGAARVVSEQAVGSANARPSGTPYTFATAGQSFHMDGLPLGSRGGAVVEHYFPSDGDYLLNIGSIASGLSVGSMEHENTLVATLDGRKFFETKIGGLEEADRLDKLRAPAIDELNARMREIPLTTTAGPHKVAVFFLHRSFAESDSPLQQLAPRKGQDAIVRISDFEIYGPVNATGLSTTPSREKIFSCYPGQDSDEATCARQIVTNIADDAFRGFLSDEDSELLMRMYDVGFAEAGFERGISFALSGILAHPKFLYRIEPVPDSLPPGVSYELSSLELASRLSFFLWS
ncbi:MAG: hypothetical protein RLZZ227_909, partial [Pseudomonadota bacterium]